MSSLRPKDSCRTTTPGHGPSPTGGTARWALTPSGSVIAGMRQRLPGFDREARAPPRAHAAFDDVPDLARAVAAQQRGADRRPLSGTADDGDRTRRVDAVRHRVEVVVGHQDGAGDALGVVLGLLADVEHLHPV